MTESNATAAQIFGDDLSRTHCGRFHTDYLYVHG